MNPSLFSAITVVIMSPIIATPVPTIPAISPTLRGLEWDPAAVAEADVDVADASDMVDVVAGPIVVIDADVDVISVVEDVLKVEVDTEFKPTPAVAAIELLPREKTSVVVQQSDVPPQQYSPPPQSVRRPPWRVRSVVHLSVRENSCIELNNLSSP